MITPESLDRMAKLGRARYESTADGWDSWPINYREEIQALNERECARYLEALLSAIRSIGGWVVYGAEEIVDAVLEAPGKGNAARDAIFEAAIDFQREIGVWWEALSPREKMSWQQRHPGEVWQEERAPPSRERASLTPLGVGDERSITKLTGAADSRGIYVVQPEEGRYVLQLDYADDTGNRLRDDRDEAGDLYELYWRFGRGTPLPGVWVDSELEPFLRYPLPRI